MVTFKRKKVVKYRGSKTHGGGAKKRRRGAGSRGGRGLAGSGKRADQKKSLILKKYGNEYYGKHGFVPKNIKEKKAVNLNYLENSADSLLKEEKILKDKEFYIINLKKLGFDKLLSKGIVSKKFKIEVNEATKQAVEKIKKAGGEVLVKRDVI